jgi:type IV pilus assembly protein PilC
MFSSRLSLSVMIPLCRTLRHYLASGLTVLDAFQQLGRSGPAPARPVARRIHAALEGGSDLSDALQKEKSVFPPLFVALAAVGEESGMLAEIFGELERFFERQKKLRNEFLSRIAWPVFQLVAAIFVIAGLIWFLGVIAQRQGPGGEVYDPLGLGLIGTSGALTFLGCVAGVVLLAWGIYLLLTRVLGRGAGFSRFLLGVPGLGPCLSALALARFSLALRLTTETGMSIAKALRLSLDATSNQAFAAAAGGVKASIQAGNDLTLTLVQTGLFPSEFQHILAVAEESGRLSEVLKQQAEHYDEEAGRRLKVLTGIAGYGVWLLVGTLIIITIFRLYSSYFGMLNRF